MVATGLMAQPGAVVVTLAPINDERARRGRLQR
jgi:hypothetical protein